MATVAIVDDDPNWPDQFRRLAAEDWATGGGRPPRGGPGAVT